jgi:quinol monooxygenase YgiN
VITRINEFESAPGEAMTLEVFLINLQRHISTSFGCESCEVLKQPDSDGAFVVIERWQSEAAHKASLASFPAEQMQAAMKLFGAPPRCAYYVECGD